MINSMEEQIVSLGLLLHICLQVHIEIPPIVYIGLIWGSTAVPSASVGTLG